MEERYNSGARLGTVAPRGTPQHTLYDQVAELDHLVKQAGEISTRICRLGDALLGPLPQDAAANEAMPIPHGGPLSLLLDRKRGELQRALSMTSNELNRLENGIGTDH